MAKSAEVLPRQTLGNSLLNRFHEVLLYDIAFSLFLSNLNHTEGFFTPRFTQAVDTASTLIRRSTYEAFIDVLDQKDSILTHHAMDDLDFSRGYISGVIPRNSLPAITDGSATRKVIKLVKAMESEPEVRPTYGIEVAVLRNTREGKIIVPAVLSREDLRRIGMAGGLQYLPKKVVKFYYAPEDIKYGRQGNLVDVWRIIYKAPQSP